MLTEFFLNELFRLAFLKKEVMECIASHLKFKYIPVELKPHRLILKSIIDQYKETNELPTVGVVSQSFYDHIDVQEVLNDIKDTEVKDTTVILNGLNQYIKEVKCTGLIEDLIEYVNNDKMSEAISLLSEGADELSNFSVTKGTSQFMKVIADFEKNRQEKFIKYQNGEFRSEKVPFGILPLDVLTNGGIDKADTALWILRSGVGKSTALKWTGMHACRMGYNVLHIQAEGSKEEAFDKYTQVWAGLDYNQSKWGNLDDDKLKSVHKAMHDLLSKDRELYIRAFEQFGTVTMLDVRQAILDYEKERDCFPDLVIVDSIDLVEPGDGKRYGPNDLKAMLQNSAKKMKNIATEFNTRVLTAIQTSEIKFEKWNDPEYNITRSDAMGDKNIANAFSYVFSGNQTMNERDKGQMRIYVDKLRNYSQQKAVYPICTDYHYGRFFDLPRTKKTFKDTYNEDQFK